jgi:hypothetical protein
MRSKQHIAFKVLNKYDILYRGQKSDAGVGLGRRRRCLDFQRITLLHNVLNVLVIELRDSVVFSVVQTVMEFENNGWVSVTLG